MSHLPEMQPEFTAPASPLYLPLAPVISTTFARSCENLSPAGSVEFRGGLDPPSFASGLAGAVAQHHADASREKGRC